jgi:hypothetical protein
MEVAEVFFFLCSVFYEAVSNSDDITSNFRMTDELEGIWREGRGSQIRYDGSICLEILRKHKSKLIQNCR